MKRVVITGIGIISSIGNNKKEVLSSLKKGSSGITYSKELKNNKIRSHVWGSIKLNISELINIKKYRFMNISSIYTFLSMEQAIIDSNLNPNMISNDRTGIIVGSGWGSPNNQLIIYNSMNAHGLRGMKPYMIIKSMSSNISACLSTIFKIRGVNYSISSASATSTHCIGNAAEIIQLGKQDIIFAGGGEELCWEIACGFDAIGMLSTKYNNTPKKSSRPYDATRDGFVISGGSGIVIIEELEHALKRNAHIYAEIISYANTSDGADMVTPSDEGITRCMKIAMKNIDKPIDYLNTHSPSTLIGDIKELWAIREIFDDKQNIAFSSTKSMTGHSLGAAGVHEIIFTILMLENNFIAPNINIENIDAQAKDMNIIMTPTKKYLSTVMSNSCGFGGTNATIIMQKYF